MVHVHGRDAVAERAERVPEAGRVGAAGDETADVAARLDQVVPADVLFDPCAQHGRNSRLRRRAAARRRSPGPRDRSLAPASSLCEEFASRQAFCMWWAASRPFTVAATAFEYSRNIEASRSRVACSVRSSGSVAEIWPDSERACWMTTAGSASLCDERVRPVAELGHVRAHGRDELLVHGRADVRDLCPGRCSAVAGQHRTPEDEGRAGQRRRRQTLHCHCADHRRALRAFVHHSIEASPARFTAISPAVGDTHPPARGRVQAPQWIEPAAAACSACAYAANAGFGLQSGRTRPGLPPVERRVVAQLEVEEASDERLAVRELDRGRELRRLLLPRRPGASPSRPAVDGARRGSSGSRPRGTRP